MKRKVCIFGTTDCLNCKNFKCKVPSYVKEYTVNPLYNDIRYYSKIRYNVSLVCTKISGSCIFSLLFPYYSIGKRF